MLAESDIDRQKQLLNNKINNIESVMKDGKLSFKSQDSFNRSKDSFRKTNVVNKPTRQCGTCSRSSKKTK